MSVVLAAAGCGGGGSDKGSPRPQARSRGDVTIAGFKFKPATVSVRQGARVRFANRDSARHTATADSGGFDSGTLRKGGARTVVFAKRGRFAYHCEFHRFMTGTVVVR
ncbi:MAG: cupredoxin family copper-binding protein [Thermoleophilaceae bacterium]